MIDAATDPFRPLALAKVTPIIAAGGSPAGGYRAILPAPLPMPETIRHPRHSAPSMLWHYRDATASLLFAVARFDLPNGGKEVLPFICGARGWVWKAPPDSRPFYGLEKLATRPGAPVLVVEGEKAADIAAMLFPTHVVLTWPGGCNAVGKADWSPLVGRYVTVWPDNDAPSHKAAAMVAKAASAAGAGLVRVVTIPAEWPDAWDVADPLPDGVTMATPVAMLTKTETRNAPSLADRDAEIIRLAALDDMALSLERRAVVQRFGLTVADLMAAVKANRRDVHRAGREAAAKDDGPAAGPPGLDPDARGRTDLFVSASDLPDTADALAGLLAGVPHLFDRGGPARLTYDTQRGGLVAEALTLNAVVNEAHGVARPWRFRRERDNTLTPEAVTLPERVAHLCLAKRGTWGLRPLDGIAAAPLLAEDGGVRVVDGYDPGSRMWCEPMPTVDLPEAPTRTDAASSIAASPALSPHLRLRRCGVGGGARSGRVGGGYREAARRR